MNIALIAHDSKKELMVQFCTAYSRTLSQHKLVATGTTGKMVAEATGLPVQRPLFLHHETDAQTHAIQDQYLYGADMLVAPVWQAGAESRPVYLPAGPWEQLWSGETVPGGDWIDAPAPIGFPAVYFNPESRFADLFRQLRAL